MTTRAALLVWAIVALSACGGVDTRAAPPASLSEASRAAYPHHALLAEHLFALASELRRAQHTGEPVERVTERYLSEVPANHLELGVLTRKIEEGGGGVEPVEAYLAAAREALLDALDAARAREPEGVSRASQRLLLWLE